jgi:uncharacterized protein (UPF0332 family)
VTSANRRHAIAAEWERAEQALADAELLDREQRHVGASSRAYYAAFHAACALLYTEGLEPDSHRGVRSLVGLHFVRTGKLDASFGRALSQLARTREDADYSSGTVITSQDSSEALDRARSFMAAARKLLEQEQWLSATGA